ncbi:MAG TPA: dihydrofolate reductase family protein [Candidatus Polarisedimenticolaceae bacterium]|nr:dihydrofolate reductase family protein [Candidatus Polarisedimenticolaceae bacterium]
MQKLVAFDNVSLDGYFTDAKGDMSWAHQQDPEWTAFAAENAKSDGGTLLFGRKTYQMMERYWPSPQARQNAPDVAEGMNGMKKVVFSRTLDDVSWQNTRLMKGDLADEVRKLKKEPGDQIVILGSGTIVSQLTQEGLIDEYQIIVHPIVLGEGRTLFEGVEDKRPLKLTRTRSFKNGNVLMCYAAGR